MEISFDPQTNEINRRKHGIELARAADLDILAVVEDARFEYGEARYRAYGLLDGNPHCLVFAAAERGVRAISLRRAHEKEIRRHVVP